MAIGAYLNVQFPSLDPKWVACGAYIIFMALNILGVGIAATFELIVTLLAIFELLVFMGVVAPGFLLEQLHRQRLGGRRQLQRTGAAGHVRRDPICYLVFPCY